MGTPNKWADVIKAWADGADVQISFNGGGWQDIECPSFDSKCSLYRIKPEPKPDVVKVIHFDNDTIGRERIFVSTDGHNLHNHWGNHVQITFDGETGKLKSAEVIIYD